MSPSNLKKYEWLGENPKGRLGRMSVSVRIYFLHWRGVIRRGDIRSTGRSLWSNKEFRWSRIRDHCCCLEFEEEGIMLSLVLIFPYFLRLTVQMRLIFCLLEDEQSLSMGEFDRADIGYVIW